MCIIVAFPLGDLIHSLAHSPPPVPRPSPEPTGGAHDLSPVHQRDHGRSRHRRKPPDLLARSQMRDLDNQESLCNGSRFKTSVAVVDGPPGMSAAAADGTMRETIAVTSMLIV